MPNRDIVAIGTSAGGVDALMQLARALPAKFPAALLVTIHLPSFGGSHLDQLLSRTGALPAAFARDGEPWGPGRWFIAPPNHHLLVDEDRLSLSLGPRENGARPAIDAMLRSTAVCCGHRAIGVVLTGMQGDGAAGLRAVARCGGISVVQNPSDAIFAEMPQTALERSRPDHVVTLGEMPALLQRLAQEPAGPHRGAPAGLRLEVDIARGRRSNMSEMDSIGRRSVLTCPDCNGLMWEIEGDELTRYRCHTGHAYTAESMGFAMDDNLRRALAIALRTLEERAALSERLQQDAASTGRNHAARSWAESKLEFEEQANTIREAIRRAAGIATEAALGEG